MRGNVKAYRCVQGGGGGEGFTAYVRYGWHLIGLIHKYYEKQLLQIYFIGINFLYELFYKKTHYFLLSLLEFDLFIEFQSPDVVHIQSGSTFDFCIIYVNDDWTLLYDFLLHSTLRKFYSTCFLFLVWKEQIDWRYK